jgi:hypothetical protein
MYGVNNAAELNVFNPPPLAAVRMHGYKVSALAHTGAFSLCSSRVRCHVKSAECAG